MIKDYQKIVNSSLKEFVKSEKLSKELAEFLLRDAKRLRPILCIKTYEALRKKKEKKILPPALSMELMHTSTLIHDDLMDEDPTRRNKPSMHKYYQEQYLKKQKEKTYRGDVFHKDSMRFGSSVSILQGNILHSIGMSCILNSSFDSTLKNEAAKLYIATYEKVNHGQQLDLQFEHSSITEKDYLRMASLKTGALIAGSLELGALLAGANKKVRNTFSQFGYYLALAFQLRDDLLDCDKNSKKGNYGSDIKKGKKTLLYLHAKKNIPYFGSDKLTRSQINATVAHYQKTGAIAHAQALAQEYENEARKQLNKLSIRTDFFEELIVYLTKRNK